jgi:hypothetical protein
MSRGVVRAVTAFEAAAGSPTAMNAGTRNESSARPWTSGAPAGVTIVPPAAVSSA